MAELSIREAIPPQDADRLWAILEPVVREGTTYPVDPQASREEVLAYWFAPGKQVFVAESDGHLLGTYNLKANSTGPADHVAVHLWQVVGMEVVDRLPAAFRLPDGSLADALVMYRLL